MIKLTRKGALNLPLEAEAFAKKSWSAAVVSKAAKSHDLIKRPHQDNPADNARLAPDLRAAGRLAVEAPGGRDGTLCKGTMPA